MASNFLSSIEFGNIYRSIECSFKVMLESSIGIDRKRVVCLRRIADEG